MGGKWLGALKEVSPWLVRIAVLYSPKTAPYAGSLLRSTLNGFSGSSAEFL